MVRRALALLLIIGCLGDPRRPASPDAPRASDAPALDAANDAPFSGSAVFGDTAIESGDDPHACGTPEAASFRAPGTVTPVHSLWIYIGSTAGDDATELDAAIYDSDGSGNPTMRLATGSVVSGSALALGQWYRLPLGSAFAPQPDHVYWIAAMCPQGKGQVFTPVYRYLGSGGPGPCDATTTQCTQHGRTGETTFDTTWQSTATYLPSTNSYYASPN